MRALVCGIAFLLLFAGCQHAKPKSTGPVVQEYALPPDEPRYNDAPPPVSRSGPQFIVGGRNSSEPPTVVRPGGTMQFIP